MILRAKTKDLLQTRALTAQQKRNSELNLRELEAQATILQSYPRRLVLELTNACNLRCIMCGRNNAEFKRTVLDVRWLQQMAEILPHIEEVTLMGWGEPTLHPRFKWILEYLQPFNVRMYFCTNGTTLGKLYDEIFGRQVDIIAVSLDGATAESNELIRQGTHFDDVVGNIQSILETRRKRRLNYPYMNSVTTLMKRNLQQLPEIVKLAARIGLDEVKAGYLTSFSKEMDQEVLYNCHDQVKQSFASATRLASELGIRLKLPYVQGEDVAGEKAHKDCYVGWRDLFVGSDGYVRPCMSTAQKLFRVDAFDRFMKMWNSTDFQEFRRDVNGEAMPASCRNCYQASHCNWNKERSFRQTGIDFAPTWKADRKGDVS